MELLKEILLGFITNPEILQMLAVGTVTLAGSVIAIFALPPWVGVILSKLLEVAANTVVKHLEQKYKKGGTATKPNVEIRTEAIARVAARVPLPLKVLPGLKERIGEHVDGAVADMNLRRKAAQVGKEIGSILNGG